MMATFSIAGRLLLCAAVLISGSQVGVRHAHAGGDVPHTHGSDGDPHASSQGHLRHSHCHGGDGHGHCHPHERPHKTEAREDLALLSPITAHIHVRLLGFQLTLPVPPGSETGEDCSQPVLVSLLNSEFLQAQSSSSNDGRLRDIYMPVSLLRDTGFVRSDRCIRPADNRPSSPPLCDAARHERSGVQLF